MRNSRYVEDRILSADPLELVHIVYQHALDMVRESRRHLASGDIAARSRSISRAINAISELDGALNHTNGGQIGQNLAELYQYMRTRLSVANVAQQDAPLAEVESLLATLAEAWNAIRSAPAAPAAVSPGPHPGKTAAWGGAIFSEPPMELAHGWSA
jgi:flagellar protein FliS